MPKKIPSCGVVSCKPDHRRKEQVAYHRFPLPDVELERFNEWMRTTGDHTLYKRPPGHVYSRKRICGRHFKEDDYLKKPRLLKPSSIPSQNLLWMSWDFSSLHSSLHPQKRLDSQEVIVVSEREEVVEGETIEEESFSESRIQMNRGGIEILKIETANLSLQSARVAESGPPFFETVTLQAVP